MHEYKENLSKRFTLYFQLYIRAPMLTWHLSDSLHYQQVKTSKHVKSTYYVFISILFKLKFNYLFYNDYKVNFAILGKHNFHVLYMQYFVIWFLFLSQKPNDKFFYSCHTFLFYFIHFKLQELFVLSF